MTDLPQPDADALAHSERLRELMLKRIREQGVLPFVDYMEQALYEPALGYYMAGAARFGEAGDFVTAPEVSALFGAALATDIRGVLEHTGGGILEFGAGSGKLALSILQALPDMESLTYSILEPSADLVTRQQHLLREALDESVFQRIRWLDALPESFTGVMVANEVMDALPVERFCKSQGHVTQLCVNDNFEMVMRPAGEALQMAVRAIEDDLGEPLSEGYQSEVCLLLKPWLTSLAQTLTQGVMLLIDYGYPRREYYLPERVQGTLACYYRHRTHDEPLRWPGLQDITAHVDFTAVAEAAVAQELDLLGYASQSAFLLDNRLLDLAEQESARSLREVERIAVARAVKTLTLPGEMGERFQVMALGRGYDLRLRGFSSQDLSHRL